MARLFGPVFRSYGNENWEFDGDGLMRQRPACINDAPIKAVERKFLWTLGRRPDGHLSLGDHGFWRADSGRAAANASLAARPWRRA